MPDDRQTSFDFVSGRTLIRESTSADRAAISQTIGRAFFDDPIAVYLFPNEATRRAGFGSFARLAMDQFSGTGVTLVTDPVRGAAIWQSPSPPQLGFWRQAGLAFRLLLTAGTSYSRALRLGKTFEKHHLKEPHWYLAILGTEPEAQGRGLGTALLQPILECCDEQRSSAYLESSKQRNIPFYQRQGFEVTGEISIPDGPTVWPMLRRPA
jgi:GNAT superfamily N-acetyltransferase